MRIALINSPIRTKTPPQHPPYGVALLAALADLEGFEICLLDVNAYRLHRELIREELRSESQEKPLSLIGISGFIPSYRWIKEILPFIRKDHSDSLIVVGGGAITSLQEDMMKWCPEIDVGVIGEGEKTFLELLEKVEKEEWDELFKIRGIIFREDVAKETFKPHLQMEERKEGRVEIVRTPARPLMTEEELDELPFPAFHLLPLEEVYWKFSPIAFSPQALASQRRLPILTSRGCNMTCKFCIELMTGESRTNYSFESGPKIRFHSPRYVLDMIKWMRLRYAVDFLNFLDECFTTDKKRVYEICDLLEKEGLSDVVSWGATAHPMQVDPEMLRRLREAGCTYLDFGFESADERILKAMRKASTVNRNKEVIQWCLQAQITPIANFIWGFPEDDLQSIYNTVKFWKDNGIEVQPFWLGPYPRTQYFEECKQRILEQYGDLEKFAIACETDTDTMMVNLTQFTDPEIIGLRELAINHDLERIKKFAELKGVKIHE